MVEGGNVLHHLKGEIIQGNCPGGQYLEGDVLIPDRQPARSTFTCYSTFVLAHEATKCRPVFDNALIYSCAHTSAQRFVMTSTIIAYDGRTQLTMTSLNAESALIYSHSMPILLACDLTSQRVRNFRNFLARKALQDNYVINI